MTDKTNNICNANIKLNTTIDNSINHFVQFNEIESRSIMTAKVKSYNKIATPFGVAFIRSYKNAFNIKCKHDRESKRSDIQLKNILF